MYLLLEITNGKQVFIWGKKKRLMIGSLVEGMRGLERIQDFGELYRRHSRPINYSQRIFADRAMEFGLCGVEIDYGKQIRWVKEKELKKFTDKYDIGDSIGLHLNHVKTIFLND